MSGSGITPSPQPGAVYDVGGAFAVYWPDVHPSGKLRHESWIVFTRDGSTWWHTDIRPDAQYLGMMPGLQRPLVCGDACG